MQDSQPNTDPQTGRPWGQQECRLCSQITTHYTGLCAICQDHYA